MRIHNYLYLIVINVLIYRIDHGQLELVCLRLGSNADLF